MEAYWGGCSNHDPGEGWGHNEYIEKNLSQSCFPKPNDLTKSINNPVKKGLYIRIRK